MINGFVRRDGFQPPPMMSSAHFVRRVVGFVLFFHFLRAS